MLAPTTWSATTVLTFILIFSSFVQQSTSTCFGWDGKEQTSEWQPCTSDSGAITTCCATNRKTPFGEDPGKLMQNSDRCLSNGLCQNRLYTAAGSNSPVSNETYWRNGCTAKDKDDKSCLNTVCATNGKDSWGGAARMTPCDGSSNSQYWCCGDSTSCCGKENQWELPKALGMAVPIMGKAVSSSAPSPSASESNSIKPTTVATSSTTTSTAVTSATNSPQSSEIPHQSAEKPRESSAATSNPPAAASGDPGLTPGAIAGITIASVIAVAALIAIFFLKRRWDHKRFNLEVKVVKARKAQEVKENAAYDYWADRVDTSSPPSEMGTNERTHELYSEHAHEIGVDVACQQMKDVV
ncbi:unnamed protein product [Periconia digitata]|uniref:Uncharacterized protein n=1 Tax=Periconia digitata TaxID=1303443 RepID=A0A9W4UCQ4_9PLEO|nr:unnamed protein product [Periconia digitata]